ncbi:MAG: hypothetical protein K2P81_09690 [Bacteriovoracaceae bacterium]|nr:hypothetical protein [Bacteriovoracaceae bacterium]
MKKQFISAFMLLASFATYAAVEIPENSCLAEVGSKRYIQNDFNASYPRKVSFDCIYDCKKNGKIEKITATSKVNVSNIEDDATQVVCQGIIVKKVAWGWDFDKVVPFYAFDTSMPELKRWAFEKLPQNNATEVQYLMNLKAKLKEVAAAYVNTKIPTFIEAAKVLENIGNDLPGNTKLLDRQISALVKTRGKVELSLETKDLVLTQIKVLANWRIPSHEF